MTLVRESRGADSGLARLDRRIERLEQKRVAGGKLVHPLTTLGDLVAGQAAGVAARLARGTNRWVLIADSTEALGLRWVSAAAALLGRYAAGASASDWTYTPGTWQTLPFTSEWIDNAGLHALSPGTQVEVPGDGSGLWLVVALVSHNVNPSAATTSAVRIAINGTAIDRTTVAGRNATGGTSSGHQHLRSACVLNLSAGDLITVQGRVGSSGVGTTAYVRAIRIGKAPS